MKKPFRLLALWDYHSFTGFATVSQNLVAQWKQIFGDSMKLDIVAINYFGENYSEGDNIRVISGKINDVAKDDFGRYVFMRSLADVDYDAVFIMQDLGVVVPMIPHIQKILDDKKEQNKKQFKSILYFPVDFALTPNLAVGLDFFDSLITYTEYGRSQVLRLNPELKTKLSVIPHGHNIKHFHPIPQSEKNTFRRDYFGEENEFKFIVGCINRNQSRKDIPTTIFGFLEYWDNYNKDSFLYLHMNPKDPMGWHLRTILAQTPLVEGRDFMFANRDETDKGSSVNKMNRIYNSLDVFLTTTTGEGWGLCVDPNTLIQTNFGVKKMADIKKGDSVLSEDGLYHDVIDKIERSDEVLEFSFLSSVNVIATKQHPFFAIKSNSSVLRNVKIIPSWIEANQLEVGDYVAIVKPKKLGYFTDKISIYNYLSPKGIKFDDLYLYKKKGYSSKKTFFSISEICKRHNSTKKVVENAIKIINGIGSLRTNTSSYYLSQILKKEGYINPSFVKIKKNINVDSDFMTMIGWYLSEGSNNNGSGFDFSLHKDEFNIAKWLNSYFRHSFNCDTIFGIKGNKSYLRGSSSIISEFFQNFCGKGCDNKYINSEIINHPDINYLISSLFMGDGYITSEKVSYSTTSEKLAWQIRDILLSNNIMCSIKKHKPRNIGVKDFYVLNIQGESHQRLCKFLNWEYASKSTRNRAKTYLEDDNYFYVRITAKNKKPKQTVMDIHVKDVHSFVGNGILLHNTITEAMACKVPVIAPKHTSIAEITDNGYNAFILESLYPIVSMVDNVVRFQSDIYEISDTLKEVQEAIYDDSAEYRNKLQRAYNFVEKLDWKWIAGRFADEIKRLV